MCILLLFRAQTGAEVIIGCLAKATNANAETWGQEEVLVSLCVTHAGVCGAWPNLSSHIGSFYAVHPPVCKKSGQTQETSGNAIAPRV